MDSSVRIGLAHIVFGVAAGAVIATASGQAAAHSESARSQEECRVRTAEITDAVVHRAALLPLAHASDETTSQRLQAKDWSALGLPDDDVLRTRCEVLSTPDGDLAVNCGCGTTSG